MRLDARSRPVLLDDLGICDAIRSKTLPHHLEHGRGGLNRGHPPDRAGHESRPRTRPRANVQHSSLRVKLREDEGAHGVGPGPAAPDVAIEAARLDLPDILLGRLAG